MIETIRIRGARVHNLRSIDVDLPRDRLVVLTGVSGSGKSSLAFDTIHAEGQRRYLECLSTYARQFLDQAEPPDVDTIEGLPPTVAIDQHAGTPGPRSTLGTLTEIYDYLRLLYARAGVPHCPICEAPIRAQTPEQMVDQLLAIPTGRKVQLLAPLVRARKGQHADAFRAIKSAGLLRARVDGELIEVGEPPPKLAKNRSHSIEAVVDRLVIREGIRPRLAESLDLTLKLGDGRIVALVEAPGSDPPWDERTLSVHLACPSCGAGLAEIEPRTFSFNSPHGACPSCDGLGWRPAFRIDLSIPDTSRSWSGGAVVPWTILAEGRREPAASEAESPVRSFLARHGISPDGPIGQWSEAARKAFWEGEPTASFAGMAALLDRSYDETRSEPILRALDAYREPVACPSCGGSRIRPEARAVRYEGRTIAELSALPAEEALAFVETRLPTADAIATPMLAEIAGRLRYLVEVGLGYLSIDRGSETLSGGELQRARLAAQLGSGLVGACYILDEPTAGLHPRDTTRLINTLLKLRDLGNSVLVVEHDEAMIRAADWVIDIGPGAGPDGGTIVAASTPDQLATSSGSITARYLNRPPEPLATPDAKGRLARSPGWIEIRGASAHNLQGVDARIPIGALTCVTGVSGSGKSSLVHDVLARSARRAIQRGVETDPFVSLPSIHRLIEVDQAPIGRTPRSTPATATGVFDAIRRVFATTREARIRGYGPGRFSFNARGGRCETCEGLGHRRIPMQYLPDLLVTCEECGGLRYNRQTLEVRYKGLSIGEVLGLRVDEALSIFTAVPKVVAGLEALHEVGLGYLTLGQSSTTLSGGEAQRIKLAAELGRPVLSASHALAILDEPTTGLHFADVEKLLLILHRLVDLGQTVVVIEHHLDVIRTADWVIDLGPEAGANGGRLVAMGPPTTIANSPESPTGRALQT